MAVDGWRCDVGAIVVVVVVGSSKSFVAVGVGEWWVVVGGWSASVVDVVPECVQ